VIRWRPAADAGHADWLAAGVNAAWFTAFAAHHSVFARARVKAALSRLLPDRLLRPIYVWVASGLFAALMLWWRPVGGLLYQATGAAALGLAAVQTAGVLLTLAAVRAIDPLELAGIRRGPVQDLQVRGPYRIVRHPLYLGWVLVVFGAAGMTGDRALFAVVSSLYLVVAIPWEERSLRDAFGDAYAGYAQRVRWRMIPGLF
jgi:protein-S-isoprenylcysteine O-methyltransferase Ste14